MAAKSETIVIRPYEDSDYDFVRSIFVSGIRSHTSSIWREALTCPENLTLFAGGAVAAKVLLKLQPRTALVGAAAAAAAFIAGGYYAAYSAVEGYLRATLASEMTDIRGRFCAPGSTYLIALVDGVPAATLALEKVNDTTAEIKRVSTLPAYQRRGLSRRLLAAGEAFARQQGYTKLVLGTSSVQHSAIVMYEAAGFVLMARHYRWFEGFAELEFEKQLQPSSGSSAAAAEAATASSATASGGSE